MSLVYDLYTRKYNRSSLDWIELTANGLLDSIHATPNDGNICIRLQQIMGMWLPLKQIKLIQMERLVYLRLRIAERARSGSSHKSVRLSPSTGGR